MPLSREPRYTPLRTVDVFDADGDQGDVDSSDDGTTGRGLTYRTSSVDCDVTKLERNLGLIAGVSLIVGNVIGSGIFISPVGVLMHTGSVGLSLIIWVFCGFITLLGALSYVELGTSYPTSGGGYLYLYETIGELPAFLLLWISCLARISTNNVILSMTFAYYSVYGFFTCVHPPESAIRLISALLISLLCLINIVSVKLTAGIQTVTVVGKLLALFVIICAGLVHVCLGNVEILNPEKIMENTNSNPGDLALAVYAGLFAYSGWDGLNILIEELRDPYRLLPLSILISVPLITVTYLLTNIAYFSALTPSQVLSSHAVAVTFAYQTLGKVAILMPLFVACSTLGGVNGTILCSSRTTFVGARKGHLPKTLAMLNIDYLTPVPSILTMGAMSLLMLSGHDIYKLITYVGFLDSLALVTPIIGMLIQRRKDPNRKRPFRVWTVVPILYILIYCVLLFLPWYSSPLETSIGSALCISGIPVYYLVVKRENKPRWFRRCSTKLCRLIQKITLSVSENCPE